MKVTLLQSIFGNNCFGIRIDEVVYHTSKTISKILNLDVDTYNQILIDKIIKHHNYDIIKDFCTIPNHAKNLSFNLNNVSKEVYINRFKEVFNKELILLALGSEISDY